jgi:hypothetical protein
MVLQGPPLVDVAPFLEDSDSTLDLEGGGASPLPSNFLVKIAGTANFPTIRKLAVTSRPSTVAEFAQDIKGQLRLVGIMQLEYMDDQLEWIGLEEQRDLKELATTTVPRIRFSITESHSPKRSSPTHSSAPEPVKRQATRRQKPQRQASTISVFSKAPEVSSEVDGLYEVAFLQRELKKHAKWARRFLVVSGLWPSLGDRRCWSFERVYSQLGKGE